TVPLRAQRLDGPLRAEVEVVGPQADDLAAQGVERMAEEQQLAGGVDVRTLAALAVPGVPDLDAIDRRLDIVVAGRPDDRPARHVAHDPGEHVTIALTLERVGHV